MGMTIEDALTKWIPVVQMSVEGMPEIKESVELLVDITKKYQKIEPKTGHWIVTGAYYTGAYGSLDYVRCSCCNYESLEEGNYCPNCGAKMGVDNGNDD